MARTRTNVHGGEEVQGLYVGIEADPSKATEGFERVADAVDAFDARLGVATERAASRAGDMGAAYATSAQRIRDAAAGTVSAVGDAAKAAQQFGEIVVEGGKVNVEALNELRSRMRAGVEEDLAFTRQSMAQVKAELDVVRNDARAGTITPLQRVQQTREALQVPTNYGSISPNQMKDGLLSGDQDMARRYQAYTTVLRELERAETDHDRFVQRTAASEAQAESAATAEIVRAVDVRIAALKGAVDAGTITREQEIESLGALTAAYGENAAAQIRIEQEVVVAEKAIAAERIAQQKAMSEALRSAMINAGYALPGGAGNALMSLGYSGGGAAGMVAGGALVGAMGVGAGVAELGHAADLAGKTEEAMKSLRVAVQASGQSWDTAGKSVEAWATLQEKTTTFDVSQTLPALRELVVAGTSVADAEKIVRVAEDASAATGKSLVDVVHGLMEAEHSRTQILANLGIGTRAGIRDGMDLHTVLDLIEKSMGGQATTIDTYADKWTMVHHNVDDLQRTLGDALLPTLKEGVDRLNDFVGSFKPEDVRKFGAEIASDAKNLGDLIDALKPAVEWLNKYNEIRNRVEPSTIGRDIVSGIGNMTQQFGKDANGGIMAGEGFAIQYPAASASTGTGSAAYAAIIEQASRNTGLPPGLISVLLGHESAGDPNAISGAGAIGLTQLMPGTAKGLGLSPADALDPSKNVNAGATYLKQMLDEFKDLKTALIAYNWGPGNVAKYGAAAAPPESQRYASDIIRQFGSSSGPSVLNPADTNVSNGKNPVGGPDPTITQLTQVEIAANKERIAGVEDWRQREEAAIQGLLASETISMRARVALEKELNTLKLADIKDSSKAQRDAESEREYALQSQIKAEDLKRKTGQESYDDEIAHLKALQAQEQQRASNTTDPKEAERMQRNVIELGAAIERLQAQAVRSASTSWAHALTEQERYYKAGKESLDQYLAALDRLEKRAPAAGQDPNRAVVAGEGATKTAESAALGQVRRDIASLTTTDKAEYELGQITRAQLEALERNVLAELQQARAKLPTGKAGEAGRNFIDAQTATQGSDLQRLYGQDATDAIKRTEDAYKELEGTIAASEGTASQKAAATAQVVENERTTLIQLAETYRTMYGPLAIDAYQKIMAAADALGVRQHDLTQQAIEDARKQTEAQTETYVKFADTASNALEKIIDDHRKGADKFAELWKKAFKDVEDALIKSALMSAFGVSGGKFDINAVLEKSLLGGSFDASGGGKGATTVSGGLSTILGAPQGAVGPTGRMGDPIATTLSPDTLAALFTGLTGSQTGVPIGTGVDAYTGNLRGPNLAADDFGTAANAVSGASNSASASKAISSLLPALGLGSIGTAGSADGSATKPVYVRLDDFSLAAISAAFAGTYTAGPGGSSGGLNIASLLGGRTSNPGAGAGTSYANSGGIDISNGAGGSWDSTSSNNSLVGANVSPLSLAQSGLGLAGALSKGPAGLLSYITGPGKSLLGSNSPLMNLFGGFNGLGTTYANSGGIDLANGSGGSWDGPGTSLSGPGALSSILAGFGYGITANSILGGNQTWGTVGSLVGAGLGFLGGPVGSAIGGGIGGLLGGFFGPHYDPATEPDQGPTQNAYGQTIANLLGIAGASGTTYDENKQLENVFGGQTALAGIEKLLSGGESAFQSETDLSAAQYAEALKMFGASATGSGTLKFGQGNIGLEGVTGAAGASGSYTYEQYSQMIAEIANALQTEGTPPIPYGSYKISSTNKDSQSSPYSISNPFTPYKPPPPPPPQHSMQQPGRNGVGHDMPGIPGMMLHMDSPVFIGIDGLGDLYDKLAVVGQRKTVGSLPNTQRGYYRMSSTT